jgi:hypothetical protein
MTTTIEPETSAEPQLVTRKPVLLQDIGRAIEDRRASLRRAMAAAED